MNPNECYALTISGGPNSNSVNVLYTEKAKPVVDKMVEAIRKVDCTIAFTKGTAEIIKGSGLEDEITVSDVETI